MKKRKKPFIIVTSILLFIFLCCIPFWGNSSEIFADLEMPVYPKGYSAVKGFEESINSKYLVYKVNMVFPPSDVILFYDKVFNNMNFRIYKEDGYGLRRWEDFNHSTGLWEETDTIPAKYIATWVDEKKEKRITLILEYRYQGDNHSGWENILLIDCKVSPFFDFRELREMLKDRDQSVRP